MICLFRVYHWSLHIYIYIHEHSNRFSTDIATSIMFSRFTLLSSARTLVCAPKNRFNHIVGRPLPLLSQASNPWTGSEYGGHPANMTAVRTLKMAPWRLRSMAIKKRLSQAQLRYKKPGAIQAASMPLSPQEMDNTMLVVLSQMGKNVLVHAVTDPLQRLICIQ